MNITDRVVSKRRFFAHLRALAASKKTGTLIVTEPGVERRLYFEDGAIVAAKSTLREESMGYLLAERDIIKANKVKQAEDLLSDKAALLGRKLLELGVMSEDEIGNAVRLTVREAISNILASPEAEITLNDEKFPDVDRVPVFVDVNRLLSAGIEASEKKIVKRDAEASAATSTVEETTVLEPEPEETSPPSPARPTQDPDSQLMQALEGFTEKYSREGPAGPRTAGPITKAYAVAPEVHASRPAKSPDASPLPVGIIAAGVVGLMLLGGGGYWFLNRSSESGADRVADRVGVPATPIDAGAVSESSTASQPAAENSPEPPAQPAAAELGTTSNAPAAPRAPERAAPAPPSRAPSAAREPEPRPTSAPPPPARPASEQPAPTPPSPQANPAPVNAQPAPSPAASQPAESQSSSPQPGNMDPEPSAPAPQPAPPEPTEQGAPGNWGSAIFAPKQATVSSAPSTPAVQTGDLVEPGFDVIDPVLIEHPKLRYPDEAKRQKIAEAVVRVRVLVDHTGAVQDAELEKGAGHGFDEVALAAALQARFIPATKDQVQVKMWTVLPLVFRLDD